VEGLFSEDVAIIEPVRNGLGLRRCRRVNLLVDSAAFLAIFLEGFFERVRLKDHQPTVVLAGVG
jgi:hypothetical protein